MKPDPRRRILWIFGILAASCPLCLCAVGYSALRNLFAGPAESLPRVLDAARKDHIPLEPEDLRPHPPIPDDQNAATVYKAFFPAIQRELKTHNITKALSEFLGDKGSVTGEEQVATALTTLREPLAEVVAASKRPFCDFHYKYEEGFQLALPEFAQAKDAVRLLAARAHMMAKRGQVAEAYDLLRSCESVGRQMGQGPLVIATLVQMSIDAIVMKEFCNLLQASVDNPALLKRAQSTLDSFGPLPALRPAFGFEVVMGRLTIHGLRTISDIRQISGEPSTSEGPGSGIGLPETMKQAFEAKLVSNWTKVFESLPADSQDWLGAYKALKRADSEIQADGSLSNTLNQILFPVFSGVPLALGHGDANRRIAATAIKLMLEHARTGKYPSRLPAYGRIATDPFDGKPLRYRLSGTGFTIYSIDRDFRDNGGIAPKDGKEGDLVRTFH